MIHQAQLWKSTAYVVVLATLASVGTLMAGQFSAETEGFNIGVVGTPWAVAPNTVPNWSVDGVCSPAMLFNDGNKGDNGTNCLKPMVPAGTGTRMVRDLNPGPGSSTFGAMMHAGVDIFYHLWVSADDNSGTHGQELYRVQGGLYPVMTLEKDINPGANGSSPSDLVEPNPGGLFNLYYSADDGVHGREPWLSAMSNGPPNIVTTGIIADINPSGSSNPSGFSPGPFVFGGTDPRLIPFAADDGTNGRELWEIQRLAEDLAVPTVVLLKDINTTAPGASSNPESLTSVSFGDNTLIKVFFTADDGLHGRELWRTNGGLSGTGLVKDILGGATGSNPTNLTAGKALLSGVPTGKLYFTVDSDGANGQELWMSGGSLDGTDTVLLKDCGASPTSLKHVDGLYTLFFVVGNNLWKSQFGTTAGTVQIKSFAAPPTGLVSAGTALYFAADDGSGNGVELWKADASGATLVKDIRPGASSSSPTNLTTVGGKVFFSADDGTNGRELWRTDTTSGALLIKDINPGSAGSNPSDLFSYDWDNSLLFFVADDGTHGRELWESDGYAEPSHVGMSYKWDLAALIGGKEAGKNSLVGTNEKPFYTYWLYDMGLQSGTYDTSEAAHQVNQYVELTDGTDRAPLMITNVDCGDGNVLRPKAALTDGSNHNAIAFGMVAVLDQDPCDTDSRAPGSPGVPVAHVPAVYDGHDWIPMDMAHIPPGIPTAPPTDTALGQSPTRVFLKNGGLPASLAAATVDPWTSRRFVFGRIDVYTDYITVLWCPTGSNTTWVATLPRRYKGPFKALYIGNSACQQSALHFYFDSVILNGGIFTTGLDEYGACCLDDGTCADVSSQAQCPGWRYSRWKSCAESQICCPIPFADADRDGDVDQADFGAFQVCYNGTGGAPAGCACFDRAKDNDVDTDDYTAFDKCFTGANVPWSAGLTPQCAP